MWDLSFLSSDQTHAPALEAEGLNHYTAREVPFPFNLSFIERPCNKFRNCLGKRKKLSLPTIFAFAKYFSVLGQRHAHFTYLSSSPGYLRASCILYFGKNHASFSRFLHFITNIIIILAVLCGLQFFNQGLNPGQGSESVES